MSYGVSTEDSFHQAARYIDGILKGANPAELPAEQPDEVLPHRQPQNGSRAASDHPALAATPGR
jgi:hypothetical protein